MRDGKGLLAVLVGGGPAPGINSAIGACTIEAANRGLDVIGIYDGFANLMNGDTEETSPLTISAVSRIHSQGGSLLRTSRANPTVRAGDLEHCVEALRTLGVDYLVTIGGDDTAFAAFEVAKAAKGAFRLAHLPKTIDNDLPLPGDMPTFGFETARHLGTQLVLNLMEDSRTGNRWVIVVAMGRKSGHLALGIGKAAGATLTVIPEEFSEGTISIDRVCDVLEGAILKRRAMGRWDGLAVVAEGVAEKLNPSELERCPGADAVRDPHGHIRLSEIPLAAILKQRVQQRFGERGDEMPIVAVTMGYELRCAPPIPFDIDYTRTLGYGAVRFLLSAPDEEAHRLGGMVYLERGNLRVMSFEDMRDPETGRTRVREVDMESEHYEVARHYMIRLEPGDLRDGDMRRKLAGEALMSQEEFVMKFASIQGMAEG